jgi:ATP-binding cassette subfamily B protein
METSAEGKGGWRVWRSIFSWGWRAAPSWLAITTGLLLMGAITFVLYPVAIAVVIDAALQHQSQRLIFGVAGVAVLYTVTWATGMLAGTAASTLADRTWLYLTARVGEQLNAIGGVDHLERPAYLTEVDLLHQNLRQLGNGSRQMLVGLQIVVRTVFLVVILGLIFPPLALLPIAAAAPLLGERLAVRIRQRADERLAADRRLADELFTLATTAGTAKELRVFGAAGPLRARHDDLAATISGGTARAALLGLVSGGAGWLLFAAAFVAGIAEVVIGATNGTTTVGAVVLAVTLIQRAQLQVGQAVATTGELLATSRNARRMLWLEDYAEADRNARLRAVPPPDRLRDGITLRNVKFGYPPEGTPVLDGIDLHLPAGTAVALVGENGAGKTTMVKLLTGMYQPTSGEVLVDGRPLSGIDLAAWRERSAAAFQDFVRFELLAGETVGLGDLPRMDDDPALQAALHRADATAVVEELSDGLATRLGRTFTGGTELSGGQWQRLALARGMMRDQPLLLVLDEPTASLDAVTEAALFERYTAARTMAAKTGAITLLVSHRFSTVRMADLIVVLADGKIAESGDHDSLIRAEGIYANLYESQARAYR